MPKRPTSGTYYDRTIGGRIRRLRAKMGLSQNDLAARIPGPPITGSQLAKKERGEEQITADFVRRVAEALQVPMIDILEDQPIGAPVLAARIGELAEPDREFVEQLIDRFAGRSRESPARRARPIRTNTAKPARPAKGG